MASLPFPCFSEQKPVDVDNKAAALAAVGRCRIDTSCCSTVDSTAFQKLVDKNQEQADVTLDVPATTKENKKLKKKYMKQGIAMATTLLTETLGLDVSIVHVDFVLDAKDVSTTEGCMAACLLDAGCAAIVIDGTNTAAMDIARIPRDRLIANFSEESMTKEAVNAALPFANTISVKVTTKDPLDTVKTLLGMLPDEHDKIVVELPSTLHGTELYEQVGQLSKVLKDGKGKIGLKNPTATELGMSYSACMVTDRADGLYTTVVCTRSGEALGLVYSSKESVVAALECGRGVYYSRSRKGLWRKGDTSGHYQTLHRLDVDCDGDAIRFTVTQRGDDVAAFCHLNTLTCWGDPVGLRHLEGTLQERLASAPEGSYTKRLFEDEQLLRDKLVEEAQELSEATEPDDVAGELADVLYFAMVRAVKAGVSIDDAVAELDKRTRKVTRRKGDSKDFRIAAGDAILSSKKG